MPPPEARPFELPKKRVMFFPEDDTRFLSQDDNIPEYFDVQFCPFQPLDQDPVFAAVSKKHVVLLRISRTADDTTVPCKIIRVIRDDDDEARNYTCTWSLCKDTGKPLLCVAGEDAKIKVYDVFEGKIATTLVGHGGDINDLVTCPTDPLLIASASDDTTVRIWSLDPIHSEQPCVCILGGEGHQWNILTIDWHETGRFMLSAGHDQTINLWTVPDLPRESVIEPLQVHYPHFSTSEVHSGLIDCVAFWGDWILSRACHDNIIVLWKIEGFSSKDPVPTPESAPTTLNPSLLTRSAFTPMSASAKCTQLYSRLMAFHTPGCGPQFFMRFKLHHAPGQNPVLAFCNANARIFFWDLARIPEYHEYTKALTDPDNSDKVVKRPVWLNPIIHRDRNDGRPKNEPTVREKRAQEKGSLTDTEQIASLAKEHNKETLQSWDGKYNASDPHVALKAHKEETVGVAKFVGRQAAWSPGGEWCVIVGSYNLILVLQRWPPSKAGQN